MLIAYKYQNKLSAGRVLAQLIKPVVADSFENFDFIICVPLHPRKLRERGFNQVDGIMSRVLDLYGKDYGTKLNRQLVSRIHDTVSQAQSDFEKRQENLKHAFAISKPNILRDKSILVVDDVMTTGATLHELMRVVKESGARDVKGLTFARRIK